MATCPRCLQEKPFWADRCPHCIADVTIQEQTETQAILIGTVFGCLGLIFVIALLGPFFWIGAAIGGIALLIKKMNS